ncbi:MAG: hypothetical protein WA864_09620 [Acetobacteraceae bacterium]
MSHGISVGVFQDIAEHLIQRDLQSGPQLGRQASRPTAPIEPIGSPRNLCLLVANRQALYRMFDKDLCVGLRRGG